MKGFSADLTFELELKIFELAPKISTARAQNGRTLHRWPRLENYHQRRMHGFGTLKKYSRPMNSLNILVFFEDHAISSIFRLITIA